MVFNGKPSAGCENCRRAKKRCDLELPACGRCARLSKTCGGYRDINDLMFRDQSATFSRRREGSQESSSIPGPSTKQPTPDRENIAQAFFYQQFVAPGHYASLETFAQNECLQRPIQACAMMVLANRRNDLQLRDLAREHYVAAIAETNQALRDSQKVKHDNTLVAVFLLGLYERLDWERRQSMRSVTSHIRGLAGVLQIRGRDQVRTQTGAALFRDLRSEVMVDALWSETSVGDHISEWTQVLGLDPIGTPGDTLAILVSKMTKLRQSFRLRDVGDQHLLTAADTLEQELIRWREGAQIRGSLYSFRIIQDQTSPLSYSGVRHDYRNPHAFRQWNLWRSLRIMLSRIQEAIWRRSWPSLQHPASGIPAAGQYSTVRRRIVDEVCAATAYAFGNDSAQDLGMGSVSSGMLMINPLMIAGSSLIEELAEVATSPGGSRVVFIDREFHHDTSSETSMQLAWIIGRLDYIAENIGVRYGGAVSRFLRGQPQVHFDLGRSNITTDVRPETTVFESQGLDLSTMRLDS